MLNKSEHLPTFDFETYSEAGVQIVDGVVKPLEGAGKSGLPAVGAPAYAEHPSTEVISLYYDLLDGRGPQFWAPWLPQPAALLNHVAAGGLLEAHNSGFEWLIWNYCCTRRYGWPALPLEQLRCSMAKARSFSVPASLGNLTSFLGTMDKDKKGKSLIQKLCRPHTPTKNRSQRRWTPDIATQDYMDMYEYNKIDVVSEMQASSKLPALSDRELSIWLVDQRINMRGLAVDLELLRKCIYVHQQATAHYHGKLVSLTAGSVETVNQNARFKSWISTQGYHCTGLGKDARADMLADPDLPPTVREAIEVTERIMSANVKKFYSLDRQVSADARLRDQYTYCGADRTGRFSAGGVQLQNMTSKGPNAVKCDDCGGFCSALHQTCPRCGGSVTKHEDWDADSMAQAVLDIKANDFEQVEHLWGDAVEALCGVIRGLFIPAKGHKFICVDFSAIEAVVLACLSRCAWRVKVFDTPGECIYTQSASKITGTSMEFYKAYKKEHGTHHVDRKKIGKVAELASGYQGWVGAWNAFGADMPDDDIKEAILKWRAESPEIVDFWGGEYKHCGPGKWDFEYNLHGLEGAAMQAIMRPGHCFSCYDITYGVAGDVLYCRLPSGRYLHYHKPRLVSIEDKLRRGPAHKITFEGWNSDSSKGRVGWGVMDTYGGRLAENVTQAVARDIQADAMVRCEAAGYKIVLHTHDEICAEVPEGFGSLAEMTEIMKVRPDWASWWPINAAGWEGFRYCKD